MDDRIILRLNYFTRPEEYEKLRDEWEHRYPGVILLPNTIRVESPDQVRGKWIFRDLDKGARERSVCGYLYFTKVRPHRYCPNCGARMEE